MSLATAEHQGPVRVGHLTRRAEAKAREGYAPIRGRCGMLLRGRQLASCAVTRLLRQALIRDGSAVRAPCPVPTESQCPQPGARASTIPDRRGSREDAEQPEVLE